MKLSEVKIGMLVIDRLDIKFPQNRLCNYGVGVVVGIDRNATLETIVTVQWDYVNYNGQKTWGVHPGILDPLTDENYQQVLQLRVKKEKGEFNC